MIRTGAEYRESIRDGREVWIDGERVDDVATHPAFKPIVDVRARIYDMAHEEATRDTMSYVDEQTGEQAGGGPADRSPPPRHDRNPQTLTCLGCRVQRNMPRIKASQYSERWKFARNVSPRMSHMSFLDRRVLFCSDCATNFRGAHIGAIA